MPKSEAFDPRSVRHILQPADLTAFLQVIEDHEGPAVLDLETTNLNEHWEFARVVTLAVTLPQVDDEGEETGYPLTYVVGLSHPDAPLHTQWREALTEIAIKLMRRNLQIIGQNIRFDVRWITALTGINLASQIVADTGMSSHLLDENQTASLKPRAMKVFGIDSWIDFDWGMISRQQEKDPRYPHCPLLAERVPYFTMAMYNARDTYWTWRLHQYHECELGLIPAAHHELRNLGDRDSINALRLGDYYQAISVPAIRTLTDLEQQGMRVDTNWCADRLAELERIQAERYAVLMEMLEVAGAELLGFGEERTRVLDAEEPSFAPTALWFRAWAEVMCETGRLRVLAVSAKSGAPSWSKAVLNRLGRMEFPAAIALLEYRKACTEASYIRSWLEKLDHTDRIHPTYNYYRVVTGRLSASEPNPQQIPGTAKNAFIASPGYALVTADYSMIEMRVAAFQAKCVPMIEALQRGDDLHKMMAASILKVAAEEITKEQRQFGKAPNFGFLFGMGAPKFVTYADETYGVMFTEEQAADARDAFFETWTGMEDWHNRQRAYAREWGYVVSPLGRLRRLPAIWSSDRYKSSEAERQAINSPVQGMASDMMLLAATKIRKHFPLIRPIALVHDAILAEVPEYMAHEGATQIKTTMENIHGELAKLGCNFSVPLVADVAIGKSWGSCEPLVL